jgi:hypothetical protein
MVQSLKLPPGEKWKPFDANFSVRVMWSMGNNQFGRLGRLIDESNTVESTSSSYRTKSSGIDPIPQLVDGPLGKEQTSLTKEGKCIHRCVELVSCHRSSRH